MTVNVSTFGGQISIWIDPGPDKDYGMSAVTICACGHICGDSSFPKCCECSNKTHPCAACGGTARWNAGRK